MLAPPPPILLDTASVADPTNRSSSPIAFSYYNRRGSSVTPRQISELQQRQQRGRLRSASVFNEGSFFANESSNIDFAKTQHFLVLENAILILIIQYLSTKYSTGINGHESLKQRRPSRAYLLRQKATGEETVVTLLPIQGNFQIMR